MQALQYESLSEILFRLQHFIFDFPVIEYRPCRTFSLDQCSSLRFFLRYGVDLPYSEAVITPESVKIPEKKAIWNIGLTAEFDCRY